MAEEEKTAVLVDSQKSGPVLCHFPNGTPSAETLNGLDYHLFASESNLSDTTFIAASADVSYLGKASATPVKYVLGVYDPKKETVQLVTPQSGSMYTLYQRLNKVPIDPIPFHLEPIGVTAMQTRDKLVDAFGSRKSQASMRKQHAQKSRMETIDSSTAPAFEEVLNASAKVEASAALEGKPGSLAPTPNLAAQTAAEVYNVNDVISEAEAMLLPSKTLIRTSKSGGTFEGFPEAVAGLLVDLKNTKGQMQKAKAAQLAYATYLIRLLTGPGRTSKTFSALEKVYDIPAEILEYMLPKYLEACDEDGKLLYQCSDASRDKMLLHLFVVLLMANDFSMIVDPVSRDLKKSPTSLSKYLKELGCTVAKPRSKEHGVLTRADLAIPLQFPKLHVPSKRKR